MTRPTRLAAAAVFALTATVVCAACGPAQPAGQLRPPASPTTAASPATGPGPVAPPLPFGPGALRAAVTLAARFATAYATRAPGEPARVWLARLAPMATRQLTASLATTAPPPLTGTGTGPGAGAGDARVRDLTPASVTIEVTAPGGTRYAVTVTRQAGRAGWVVYDIEPAAAGNSG